jgi:GNAT superfamily N-acetyltransferase
VEDAISWAGERGFASWRPGSFGPDREGRERLRQALEAGELYLILVNGETAGTLSLLREDRSFWPRAPADALYLHRFAVRGSHAGKGIGSAAIAWAAEEARRRGRRFLRLDCLAENPGIRTYYERAGFEHRTDAQIDGIRFALYERDLSDDRRPLRAGSRPDVTREGPSSSQRMRNTPTTERRQR